jgi:hypothetical protein
MSTDWGRCKTVYLLISRPMRSFTHTSRVIRNRSSPERSKGLSQYFTIILIARSNIHASFGRKPSGAINNPGP